MSKKKKVNYKWEIISIVFGITAGILSQFLGSITDKAVTKAEIARLNGNTSLVYSDFITNVQSNIPDIVLVFGICIVILAGYSAFQKYWRNK